MCGIAGILNLEKPAPISVESAAGMVGALAHRGPDEAGLYLDDWAALGHARLSIIDLATGTQPLANEDESLWITFNGEIFNYPELHEDLVRRGHRFRTASDTEVIVHLYEEYGPDCLAHLNGQFAFAIWDARRRRMFLARDRFGILPLYYAFAGGRFYFASEAKALFAVPEIEPRLDPRGIGEVFTYWSTAGERTAFQGVEKLAPGHWLMIGPGIRRLEQYWALPFPEAGVQPKMTFADAAERVRELLLDAVRIRLRADVPVGAYLSGGIDSSVTATLARRHFVNYLKTFGIRFADERFDEGAFQEQMVAHLQVDHESLRVDDEAVGAAMREVVWHCETPMLRTAPAPLFLLSRRVRQSNLKVVLTGEGSDEMFAGYNIFKEAKIRAFWAREPQSECRPLPLRKIYPYVFRDARLYPFLKSFYARGLDEPADPLFSHRVRWENTSRLWQFFTPEMRGAALPEAEHGAILKGLPAEFERLDPVAKAQYLECRIFLSGYLLSCQADRVAMAHGVEIRVPFLDHRLAEFLAKIPSAWKLHVLNEKFLLKKAFESQLPPDIARRAKHPYRAPIHRSLLTGPGGEAAREALSGEALERAGLFDPAKVAALVAKLDRRDESTEVEDMALAGIVTTQWLHAQFCEERRKFTAPEFRRLADYRSGSPQSAAAPRAQ